MDDDVVSFPTIPDNPNAPGPLQDQSRVTGNDMYGSGTVSGLSTVNYGGPSGLTLSGTQGIWAGALTFPVAPWSVDLLGNMVAKSASIQGTVLVGSSTGAAVEIYTTTFSGVTGPVIQYFDSSHQAQASLYYNTAATLFAVQTTNGSGIFMNTASENMSLVGINIGLVPTGVLSTNFASETHQTTGNIFFQASTGGTFTGSFAFAANNAFLTSGGNFSVNGNFQAFGTKAFDIPHPTKKGMRLQYVAIESPEVIVVCRGKGAFLASNIPQHFKDVTEIGSIQVTQGNDPLNGGTTWIATGVRKGYADHKAEYVPDAEANAPQPVAVPATGDVAETTVTSA